MQFHHPALLRKRMTFTVGLMFLFVALATNAGQGPAPAPSSQATAVIRGKILFEGETPVQRRVNTVSDPLCASFSVSSEDVVVRDKGLENVMVYVSSPVRAENPPDTVVTLDYRECRFDPHVLTLQVGQGLRIRNTDVTVHNAHAWPRINQGFNMALRGGAEFLHVFRQPEASFPIRDDVHNWESSFVGVFNHPYHAVSKSGGLYELIVPAGEILISARHEKLGEVQQTVKVVGGVNSVLDFVFRQP